MKNTMNQKPDDAPLFSAEAYMLAAVAAPLAAKVVKVASDGSSVMKDALDLVFMAENAIGMVRARRHDVMSEYEKRVAETEALLNPTRPVLPSVEFFDRDEVMKQLDIYNVTHFRDLLREAQQSNGFKCNDEEVERFWEKSKRSIEKVGRKIAKREKIFWPRLIESIKNVQKARRNQQGMKFRAGKNKPVKKRRRHKF